MISRYPIQFLVNNSDNKELNKNGFKCAKNTHSHINWTITKGIDPVIIDTLFKYNKGANHLIALLNKNSSVYD